MDTIQNREEKRSVQRSSELLDLRTLKTSIDGKANSSHTHNYAGSSSAGGAATSANTLTTARTINGTSFNGSANITTANWGTARTLTIGNTGKSVNGAGNVSWSLAEIGAAAASHGNHVPATQTANARVFLRNDNTWQTLPSASTSATGIVQLSTATNSTSTTLAATASAVKAAYDRAEQAFQSGNDVKQKLVDTLIANSISASTSSSWDVLINSISSNMGGSINILVTNTLPSQVVENQIIIKSNEQPGSVFISPDSTKSLSINNDIQISYTDTINNFPCKLTSGNKSMTLYLYGAYQRIGGTNKTVDAYVGISGSWKQFSYSSKILFKDGQNNLGSASYSNSPVISVSGDRLIAKTYRSGAAVHRPIVYGTAIDLTRYNTLKIVYDKAIKARHEFGFSSVSTSSVLNNVKAYIETNGNNVWDLDSNQETTLSLDISSLSGSLYFYISIYASTSYERYLYIKSIELI